MVTRMACTPFLFKINLLAFSVKQVTDRNHCCNSRLGSRMCCLLTPLHYLTRQVTDTTRTMLASSMFPNDSMYKVHEMAAGRPLSVIL